MSEFDELWKWAASRGKFQQEYSELNHVYNLMKSCNYKSYLEVGSAEGNSLYILGSAAEFVDYIDIGEAHTDALREDAIKKLGKEVNAFIGDSTNPKTYFNGNYRKVDCVLIDGGHDFATVLSDSILYASLATKYVFWHDVQLPQVRQAVDWFMQRNKLGNYSEFINSETYGYGICEVK